MALVCMLITFLLLCVCVAEVQMHVFKAFVSNTEVSVSSAKSVRLQNKKHIGLQCELVGSWFRSPPKKRKETRKKFSKSSFQVGKKYRKKEWMKESKKTTIHLLLIFCWCRVYSLLAFLDLYLVSVPLFQVNPILEMKLCRNFFPSIYTNLPHIFFKVHTCAVEEMDVKLTLAFTTWLFVHWEC